MANWDFLNEHRLRQGQFASSGSDGCNGAFSFPMPGEARRVFVIASDGEEWRPVPKWESLYEVSTHGRVRSFPKLVPLPHGGHRTHGSELLKQETIETGYMRVSLSNNGSTDRFLVHQLVALTFIENPSAFPEVNHRNGSKTCNLVGNLEWCTQEYNMHHAIENGLKPGWTSLQIEAIKLMFNEGLSCVEIAAQMNASRQSISGIAHGRHRSLEYPEPSRWIGLPLWKHVSVSFGPNKATPSWAVMCFVKDLFWDEEATVMQLHVPKSEHVSFHDGCLHLWEPMNQKIPTPPAYMVGPK